MNENKLKNTALATATSFYYQCLVGTGECFAMQEGESIWFEFDGDVSRISEEKDRSSQIEVKMYSDKLTDHHENLWKTLKNWLAPEFSHESYCSLVLLTTQEFGSTALINEWENKNSTERFDILHSIYNTRTPEELGSDNPTGVLVHQKAVIECQRDKLLSVLGKVKIVTQFGDETELRNNITSKLVGIPKSNRDTYLESLIGFVYAQLEDKKWEISRESFDSKCEELTSLYNLKEFTVPSFEGREATDDELSIYEEKLFVKKIRDIDYEEVISEAIGNWLELNNSLDHELNGAPQYRDITNRYQGQLIKQFKRKYATKCRNSSGSIGDSKDFYDQVIAEPPFSIATLKSPPFEYKNGLIQDAMDNQDQELKWKIEPR